MAADLTQIRVLVVDDNATIRELVTQFLFELGIVNVRSAQSGQQALTLLKKEPAELLLSDGVMPGLNGVELLHAVRAMPGYEKIPFIMISGYPEKNVVEAATQGISDYILKPFSFETFASKVKAVLARVEALAPKVVGDPAVLVEPQQYAETIGEIDFGTPAFAGKRFENQRQQDSQKNSAAAQNQTVTEASSADHLKIQNRNRSLLNSFSAQLDDTLAPFHAKKDDALIYISPAARPVSVKDVRWLCRECSGLGWRKLVVLSSEFEPGILHALEKLEPPEVQFELRYIPQEKAQVSESALGYRPVIAIEVQPHLGSGSLRLELTGYLTSSFERSTARDSDPAAWQPLVRCWSVALNFGHNVAPSSDCFPKETNHAFKCDWRSDDSGGSKNQFITPYFQLGAGEMRVAVRVQDELGNDSIRLLDIEARR